MKSDRLPTVLIFPGKLTPGFASDLRADAIVSSLGRLGWRCAAVSPKLGIEARRRIVDQTRPDLLFFQQTRHELNDPDLFPGMPCVFDIDDSDMLDARKMTIIPQRVAKSIGLVAGSRFIADQFASLGVKTTIIWTGSYVGHDRCRTSCDKREPIVTWAVSTLGGYPDERQFIIKVALGVARRYGPYRLVLFGVTSDNDRQALQSHMPSLAEARISVETFPMMPYRAFVKKLERCAVGLAPLCVENPFSRGKSFGKVLAYLAAECPIVATPVADHPLFFRDGQNGFLRENDPEKWADIVVELLRTPDQRARIAENGKRDFLAELSTQAAAAKLDRFLRQLILVKAQPAIGA